MDARNVAKSLHPLEVKLILRYGKDDELDASRLVRELGYKEGQANQAFSWLASKGLASEKSRTIRGVYEITALGREMAAKGSPEGRILAFIEEHGPILLPEIASALGLEQKDAGSAFGALSKDGVLGMDESKRASLTGKPAPARIGILNALLGKAIGAEGLVEENELSDAEKSAISAVSKKRGSGDSAFRFAERERVVYRLVDEIVDVALALAELGLSGDELGAVTPEILAKKSWEGASFRPYNVKSPTTRLIPGRRNPYVEFLESVKDKLVSLGFEEFDGGLVETEFWNSDALFMPQFHSARDIHDVYHLADPVAAKRIEEPHLSRIAAAHENGGETGSRGWNYKFDRDFTRRLILRSQGTVLSARQLPTAKVPGKYFGIARCFRYDRVDATHLSDFYQTEGIVLGNDVNLRTLLGFLEMFAVEVAGAKEVKYVPGYFPFTEPSIEVHIKHPVLGWFELGGSGIFRPEVTESLGVKVPVLAWGIGIDRMALMALGLNDLRELFSPDLESVRYRRAKL
ncbi:MAG: phenylalanine--tRNA ligase subunit alpha [Spirochaetota bacterium]